MKLVRIILLVSILIFNLFFPSSHATKFKSSQTLSSNGKISYNKEKMRLATCHGSVKKAGYSNTDPAIVGNTLDLYIIGWWATMLNSNFLSDVHQQNPDIDVLLYRNFRAVTNSSNSVEQQEEFQMALDKGWLLKDSEGDLIHHTGWTNNYMVDIGNPDYQDYLTNWVSQYIQEGFDGLFLDLGLRSELADIGMKGTPINPRTGESYTDDEWVDDLITLETKIRKANPDILMIGNGIASGSHWFDEKWGTFEKRARWKKMLNTGNFDGFISESTFYFTSQRQFPSEQEYKLSLDFLVWVQENWLNDSKKIYLPGLHCTSSVLPEDTTQDELMLYFFSSCLLGLDSLNQVALLVMGENVMENYVKTLINLDMGSPLGPYTLLNNTVYERNFNKGKILVNPSSNIITINLDREYVKLNGEVVSSVTLDPHRGMILQVS